MYSRIIVFLDATDTVTVHDYKTILIGKGTEEGREGMIKVVRRMTCVLCLLNDCIILIPTSYIPKMVVVSLYKIVALCSPFGSLCIPSHCA